MHGFENAPQVLPRRRIAVEALQEQHVADEARHPAHRRAIADDGSHPARLEELPREALAAHAAEHAAGTEVHQVAIAARAVAGEGLAKLLAGDAAEHGRYRRGSAMEREVVDRRVEKLLLPPHHAARAAQVVCDAFMRIDEAVRHGERRMHERRHRLEESLDRERLEEPLVPVRLEADEFRRDFRATRHQGAWLVSFGGSFCKTVALRAATPHVTTLAAARTPVEISAW